MKEHEDRLNGIDNKLLVLSPSGGDGVDMGALEQLLANLRKEFDDKYARKEEIPPINARLDGLEEKSKELSDTSEDHEARIKALEELTQ